MAKKRRTCCVVLVSDLFMNATCYLLSLPSHRTSSSARCLLRARTQFSCDAPTNLSIGVSCKAKRTSFGNMSAWQRKTSTKLKFHRHRVSRKHLNRVEHLLLPQICSHINTDYSVCARRRRNRRLVFAQAKNSALH